MTRRARLSVWAWIGLVVVGTVGIVLLVWKAPEALYRGEDVPRYRSETAQAQALNGRMQALATTRAALVAGLAGLAALGGLWLNARTLRATLQAQEDARGHQQESLRLDREGHITDRYTKAIDQLGSATLDVRLGGIYALERLMRDSPGDQTTIVEVLAAYVREHAPASVRSSSEPAEGDKGARPASDVHAALTVLARRARHSGDRPLDLTRTVLVGASFPAGANLAGALFWEADLTRSDLPDADLTDAALTVAVLTHANLNNADLTRADLNWANLARASMRAVNLTRSFLGEADLRGTVLVEAIFADTYLRGADVGGALMLRGALTDEQLSVVRGADKIKWVESGYLDRPLVLARRPDGTSPESRPAAPTHPGPAAPVHPVRRRRRS